MTVMTGRSRRSSHGKEKELPLSFFMVDQSQIVPPTYTRKIDGAAPYVNGLLQYYTAEVSRLPSEKRIGTILAVEKGIGTGWSENFEPFPFTHGMGICVEETGGPYYLVSSAMQKKGGYKVIRKGDHCFLSVGKPLMRPSDISDISKNIIQTCKRKSDGRIRKILQRELKRGIGELEEKYKGLFENSPPYTLKETVLNTDPLYHLPQLVQPDFLEILLKRTLDYSRVRSLLSKIGEKIKNDEKRISECSEKILHSVATEVVEGMVKSIVYLCVWNYGDFLKEFEQSLTFRKPSPTLLNTAERVLIFLGLRRWHVAIMRSSLPSGYRKRDPEHYSKWYETLHVSALDAGIQIDEAFTLYELEGD